MAAGIRIEYKYTSPEYSANAVDHVFRYISRLTGIEFYPGKDVTAVIIKDVRDSGGKLAVRHRPGDSAEAIVTFDDDPVEKILNLLTLRSISAPEKGGQESSSEIEAAPLSRRVSELMQILIRYMIIPARSRAISIWPEGRRFGAVATHDIDMARRSLGGGLRLLFETWPAGRMAALADTLKRAVVGAANPYDCINGWLEMESELGIVSTFFVFSGRRRHPNDPKYDVSSVSRRLKEAIDRGHEVAFHSGIESRDGRYLSESFKILEESLRREILGLRPHYLSAAFPSYWRRASEIGFRFSSSLGYDDRIGYLGGVDLPFIPFDTEYDRPLEIVEFPIAIMDCGLIGSASANDDSLRRKAFDLIDTAEENGALVALDWHQRTLYDLDYPGWGGLYRDVVEYLLQKQACFHSMSGMAEMFLPASGDVD